MKIILDVDNRRFEYETNPMPPERFAAVCRLLGAVIGGGVLLGAIALVGFWVIPWAVGAYKLIKAGF